MSQEGKKLTITEFRFWLEGVEEMQSDEWNPNPQQWKRIREKIDLIQDQPLTIGQQYPQNVQHNIVPPPVRPAGGGLGTVVPNNNRPQPSLFANADNANMVVKTPEIDTTNGRYESAFE
ncbi:MAG: hypothetical protein ACXW2E_00270 [Nitrososphaeraceae archaeon]